MEGEKTPMALELYQSWSRGRNAPGGVHQEKDAASRLTADGVVEIFHQPKFKLRRTASIFAIGSCFARNIEEALVAKGFKVASADLTLPDGVYGGERGSTVLTKFNTLSMLAEVKSAFGKAELADGCLIEVPGERFWNPQLHRLRFAPKDVALAVVAAATETVLKIAQSDLVIVTLGLTEYWFDKQAGAPLNDTPNDRLRVMFGDRFEHRNAGFGESFSQTRDLCKAIFNAAGEDARIVITVSPVPLQRTFSGQDVIVANSYSKSTLRAVAQEIAAADDRIDYFPSYEIVTNSPRAVAWEHDQRHVRLPVVEAIVEKFEQLYFE